MPYIDHLPGIAHEEETLRRTNDEVGIRIICLALVSMKGAGAPQEFILNGVKHYGVVDDFSPNERALIFEPNPDENTKIQLSWRAEAAHALLWAVGQVDALSLPTVQSDWNALWKRIQDGNREPFLAQLNLRLQSEILDQTDLTYRLHWAAFEAIHRGLSGPPKLNHSVVQERHYALNWLTDYKDDPTPWDQISTDT